MSSLVTAMLFTVLLLVKLCPLTPLSRWINTAIVAPACKWLIDSSRRDIINVFVLCGILLFAGEVVMMLGSADLVFAYALDLSLYIDAIITVSVIGAASQLRNGWDRLATVLGIRSAKAKAKPRARRTRSVSSKLPANDEDGPALLAA